MKISRRKFVKALGVGAAAAGAASYSRPLTGSASTMADTCDAVSCNPTDQNSLFDNLCPCCPGETLVDNEVRITFLGTSCIPRLSQQGVSVYVEFGPTNSKTGLPFDYVMFDCGMGILANYIAMGIPYSRMDKIFIAHLHADHMGDLSPIYCFGEAADRKSPLFVWGPSPSGWPDPVTGKLYNDGIKGTLEHFREVWRWHTESFSFASNSYTTYQAPTRKTWGTPCELVPVGPTYRTDAQGNPIGGHYADPFGGTTYDAYALVPIELDWTKYGEHEGDNIAYWNRDTGVKITHFPAIHTRRGSVSYKLEWIRPGESRPIFSMIYSGDTKPNNTMLKQAAGIDVWAHEIVMPPDQWAAHSTNTPVCQVPETTVETMAAIQNSSHTTQAAFGYMLSQIKPAPRLTIATHFQAQDDTIYGSDDPTWPEIGAQTTIDEYLQYYLGPEKEKWPKYTFAADFMVFNVKPDEIKQRRAVVSKFAFGAKGKAIDPTTLNTPKYWTYDADGNKVSNPTAQIDLDDEIKPGPTTYDDSGYFFDDKTSCQG